MKGNETPPRPPLSGKEHLAYDIRFLEEARKLHPTMYARVKRNAQRTEQRSKKFRRKEH